MGMNSVTLAKMGTGLMDEERREFKKHGDSSSNSGTSTGKEGGMTITDTFTSRKQ